MTIVSNIPAGNRLASNILAGPVERDTAPLRNSAPAVRVNGNLAEVAFARYDLDAYRMFLSCKALPESQLAYDWQDDRYTLTTPARFAALLGLTSSADAAGGLPLAKHLFDYQRFVVERAMEAERFAAWLDTGLGKTAVFLEWARQVIFQTKGRVLILTPLQVIPQVIEEATRFYGDGASIQRLRTRDELAAWCVQPGRGVGICNYEKFIPGILPELRHLAGLVADESSLLKGGGGKIKWHLIKSARGIRFKLSCTATPAPNDTMEYASQAGFLEKLRNDGDILWTFFTRDKRGNWRVKPHARKTFYRFMSSWSIYMRDPARFGWNDLLATLPPPEIIEYRLEMTPAQRQWREGFLVKHNRGFLVDDRLGVQERSKLSQLAKGFLYDERKRYALIDSLKPLFVAELVRREVAAGRQVLVWTVFDAESEIIAEALAGLREELAALHGGLSDDARADVLDRFRRGEVRVLISKAQLVGYGLNFQHCRAMVFSGFDDSFERLYQAIRRCYRYGQTETVRVHIPYIPELEGLMLSNVKRKQAQFDEDTRIQEEHYRQALGIGAEVA